LRLIDSVAGGRRLPTAGRFARLIGSLSRQSIRQPGSGATGISSFPSWSLGTSGIRPSTSLWLTGTFRSPSSRAQRTKCAQSRDQSRVAFALRVVACWQLHAQGREEWG